MTNGGKPPCNSFLTPSNVIVWGTITMSGKLTDLVNRYLPDILNAEKQFEKAVDRRVERSRLANAIVDFDPTDPKPPISNFTLDDVPRLDPADDMYTEETENNRDKERRSEIAKRIDATPRKPDNELYDSSMMNQPVYETDQTQILNDIASDESVPALVHNISTLSRLGIKAKARLIARTIAFQSKNQVFSNIINLSDYQAAQDDFEYAQILSKSDFTTFDVNSDYYTAEAIMEAQFNIRLRRSRNALNLQQINTQRSEYVQPNTNQPEEKKLRQRIPLIGSSL